MTRREWLPIQSEDNDIMLAYVIDINAGIKHQFESTYAAGPVSRPYCRVCSQKLRHDNHRANDGKYEDFDGVRSRSVK